ncbi:MAG: argininosuccinate lyase [Actinobacteria bacterium]|nr:argininosuccinate lyase [Actinomycetota bacterium]MBU1944455.1 argininosuccinate lyase [Actinomycetota bacterium]MBU2688620.1 argininosuccinate lyase [Actinomycetota bacterium]
MWGGRFGEEPDVLFIEFGKSISFDARLYPYDIDCTAAWSDALLEAGVLSGSEHSRIDEALELIEREMADGSFEFKPSDEDIHTAIERRLVELVGTVGGKVRTGRSRNDQVACDMRLFVLHACELVGMATEELQETLIERAQETVDVAIPGHTHLQQAQPVLLGHVLLAFVHMLERDLSLLLEADASADSLPLGSGALAGTPVPVDREVLASRLGFSAVSQNSVDAVSDRDFVCATLFALTMIMSHLSRLSEQIILWCSQEFGLVQLDDAWATGSSLMPQKKNPDGPELIRGKTGRVTGSLVSVLTMLKGLPLAYNRDLQEDKEPLFDAVDTVLDSLAVMQGTVSTMRFDRQRARELTRSGFMTATDLADFLVSRELDFPEAHRIVGEVVHYCLKNDKTLWDLDAEELKKFSPLLGEEAAGWLSVESSLARRGAIGGTAPREVARQLDELRRMIEGDEPPPL